MVNHCVECVSELAEGTITAEEVSTGEDCTECDRAACERHGKQYRNGWEHETCHETPDYDSIARD